MSNVIKYDFEGKLYSFNLNGWFNATEAAKRYGKGIDDWLALSGTLEYIQALDETLTGRPGQILHTRDSRYVKTSKARVDRGGGTWLHPKLAVRFAQWLNAKFAVWCDLQIDTIIRNSIRAEGNTNLLPLFLRDSAATWELRFEPSYYRALARMTGTHYTGHAGGTSPIYGAITEEWVYGCILPADVHAELKARRQKSEKMHQWLTAGGQDVLDRQIALVTAIAASSADYQDFKARMMAVSNRSGQLGFVYPRVA
ncbi:KilA-N domain-containing protein [Castellaniella hirudinis]|uniref:KilA-N domain-containing protein n=1 Tax=Castellaniella hirudinis TaxID=1144617 RepID=UPI0039C0DABA